MEILQPNRRHLAAFLFGSVLFFSPLCSHGAELSLGKIYVAPHAMGHIMKLLGRRFKVLPVSAKTAQRRQLQGNIGGVLLGSKDLKSPAIARLAKDAYAAGLTVAVVGSGSEEAEALRILVGRDLPIVLGEDITGKSKVSLVAIREDAGSECCQIRHQRTHILKSAYKKADHRITDWLKQVFQSWPTSPPETSPEGVQDDLTQMANSILTGTVLTDKEGGVVQVVNQTWAARSFASNLDFYYVQQWVTIANPHMEDKFAHVDKDVAKVSNAIIVPISLYTKPLIVQYAPGTTENATTYSSGVEYTIGGTAGYNKADILSVAASMKISNSTSTTVSPTQIEYSGSPGTGIPEWKYTTKQKDQYLDGDTYIYTQNWIWAVPFDAYADGETSITYSTRLKGERETVWYSYYEGNEYPHYELKTIAEGVLYTAVPFPFNDTELSAPSVISVDRNTAKPGDVITVTGTNLYLIESVVIGGNPLPAGNYEVVDSDTTIRMVIPANQEKGPNQSIVINTQEGFSNSNVVLSID